jgi:THO complex subunit 2
MFLFVIIQLDTRRILKRLAKENLKQLGRMVAKLAHANPMTVLRTIVHQVLFFF